VNFDQAFAKVIGHEGGYVNSKADPGGETKFGISKRSYPSEDIPNLTLERAKEIYLRDYWGPAGCDAAPDLIRFDLFDMAVNSGVRAAVKAMQKAVGETEDGILGPLTLQSMQSMPTLRLVARFNGARLLYISDATAWPAFGRGWCKRIGSNLLGV
jgi:lysozyme family protein